MVTIVNYKTYHKKEDGDKFFALVVQGGIEAVRSNQTGRTYLTARTAQVTCTFGEETCKNLISTEMPGRITKVEVDPYEYTIPETGEILNLKHRYQFMSGEESVIEDNVQKESAVL